MTMEIGLGVASLLILFCAAACVVLISALLYPVAGGWLNRLAPATRANVLFAWATAPVWLSITLLLLVLSPSIAHTLGFGVDHCHEHGHHVHLCVVHTPWVVGSTIERLVSGGLIALVLAWLIATGTRLGGARAKLELLRALSSPSTDLSSTHIVSSQRPFVFTAGILRPQIYCSSALLKAVDPNELATVIAHEHAHQRRRDGLRLFIADLFGDLHWSPIRRRILADLHLAVEQACDEVAAEQSGDRLQVAETILHLTRLIASPAPRLASVEAAFTGSDAAVRIEGLLRPPIPQHPAVLASVSILAAGLLLLAFASSDWWHHSAETLLGYLLG